MENELDNLLNEMIKKWFNGNIKRDFKYYELFTKINKFLNNMPIIRSEYAKDLEIASIMTFIERQFSLPMLDINIKSWKEENKDNPFILKIYTKLSNLRSL